MSRSRLCKVCGDWHALERPWPHNCRPERPPRSLLSAPQLAPRFGEFVAGEHDAPIVINDRRQKRSFMDAHDLVEYDAGIERERAKTDLEWQREFVADFKQVCETDPLNRPPVEVIGQSDTAGAGEIDTTEIEVFK